jgi:hypothetical protein
MLDEPEFLTSKRRPRVPFFRVHRLVTVRPVPEGSVGVRSAAASVCASVGFRGVTALRALAESPDIHAMLSTGRTRNVMSPRWYCAFAARWAIMSAGTKLKAVFAAGLSPYAVWDAFTSVSWSAPAA